MLKLMCKKIFTILRSKNCLSKYMQGLTFHKIHTYSIQLIPTEKYPFYRNFLKKTETVAVKGDLETNLSLIRNSLRRLRNSYTMGCPPVRGDNPRALASGLSYEQVDKYGITILYNLHQCRPCT